MAYLSFQGQIIRVQSKVDKTCKIEISTQELGSDAGELMNMSGDLLNVGLRNSEEGNINPNDIPAPPKDDALGNLTWSQKVRFKLYRIWEAKGGKQSSIPFEVFYAKRMGDFNQQLQVELDRLG